MIQISIDEIDQRFLLHVNNFLKKKDKSGTIEALTVIDL